MAVRITTQAADGTLQVGMASYVLFSPEEQPNALAIAAVLAITLLPFSVIGPFVSVVLDRWPRQRVLAITDAIRGVIALALAALVITGSRAFEVQATMMVLLLIAMSLNRFLMAALTAGLPYTIDKGEYLTASSVMPMIGPLGVLIGGAIAAGFRLGLSPHWISAYQADALVFVAAFVLFALAVALSMRFTKHELGPDPDEVHDVSTREVITGLRMGMRHLSEQGPTALGLLVIFLQRLAFGLISVGMILGYRNTFHEVSNVNAALADIGLWAGATGLGFMLSSVLVPPIAHKIGVRKTVIVLLVASGLAQIFPGSIFERIPLLVGGFLIGLFAQAIKVCIDTVVQAHVDDRYKGRIFVIYDMLFNAAMVVAAFIAVVLLPPGGFDVVVFVGVGVFYLLLAGFFWWRSNAYGDEDFNRGTQIGAAAEPMLADAVADHR
ncbi:MFS transporter [Propionibacteriaceae bacterium G1746]